LTIVEPSSTPDPSFAVEKRQSQRVPLFPEIIARDYHGGLFNAQGADISEGGASIVVDRPLRKGSEFSLFFSLPLGKDTREVMVPHAIVCYAVMLENHRYKLGMKFMGMTPESAISIQQYIKEHLPEVQAQ
jgi:c-di-GMP-binding flagellar brake protein YcgR